MKASKLAILFTKAFNPAQLFRAGEQGAWYDPADLESLRQESTGVTAAAVGSLTSGLFNVLY